MHMNSDTCSTNGTTISDHKLHDVDDEDDLEQIVPNPNKNSNNNSSNSLSQYIDCENTGRTVNKRKREAKLQIDKDMAAHNQKIIQYEERYFVREGEKRQKAALTLELVEKGIVAFLRDVKRIHNVTEDVGREFGIYLTQRRDMFGTVKKSRIVCTKKRPIDSYFG